ncbi:E3 ubiquitin-protein ligase MARCH3-like isoform X1 [Sander lucioperca]|uniref:E3 ubiquitin-protein ligase MARCH3-like isoform X1 n=1 Tax=Sander lucioperca TaxID=283035 RepID=UPI00125E5CF4|nr:E3 ubiquitin-protein ligase MARCH3-like isoform X1 [Sander lucioperca]XP_035855781.1 E3 ubiquitin-protein ligase MARCH3-like isoform X1 [Sander lucioperca]XP_035855782.1 E3 ubiquitin-protein ligase MARCH3-like isoform X1 [Sander lucioperca]
MAPYIADMSSEEPLGPWVPNPVGEVKVLPEHGLEEQLNSCNQEVTHYHTCDMATEECAAIPDSLCSDEPFCRICHEGSGSEELLSPCECCGSLAMVHRTCLEHWLTASNSSHCELCHHQFALERLPKPLTEWLCAPSVQQQRRTLCGDVVCFLFITPLASLSGWLCVQGAMDLYYTNTMEALGLLVLTLALFTIYVFWTMVSVRYHMHLFQTWKKTDQRVRLQIPLPPHTTLTQQTLSINLLSKAPNKETMV